MYFTMAHFSTEFAAAIDGLGFSLASHDGD
jgi:hypothetical protein